MFTTPSLAPLNARMKRKESATDDGAEPPILRAVADPTSAKVRQWSPWVSMAHSRRFVPIYGRMLTESLDRLDKLLC